MSDAISAIKESNATSYAIQKVASGSKEIIDSLDQQMFNTIQPIVNRFYQGEYGEYFQYTLFGIPIANLIAAIVVFALFLFLREYFTRIIVKSLLYFAKKTESEIDDLLILEIRSPLRFLFVIMGTSIFFHLLFVNNLFTETLVSTMLIIDLFWVFYAITPSIGRVLYDLSEHNRHLSYELSRFIIRLFRALIVMMGFIALLYNFGVNVTAFLASLGLGGLAFALAARDTAANLFGSIALMLDGSIKVGEWIVVNGVEGIVEDIGMRTTKIRTFEKSFVVVPNSIVANSNIENFSRRGIRRIKMVIGVTYDTSVETMKSIVSEITTMLKIHPGIAHDQTLLVRFDRFDDSSLGIFVYTFTNTSNWSEYLRIKEEINLNIMEIVRRNGSDFAFPSHSLYIEKIPVNGEENPLSAQ